LTTNRCIQVAIKRNVKVDGIWLAARTYDLAHLMDKAPVRQWIQYDDRLTSLDAHAHGVAH
jgi:hypothetical protein